MNSRERIRLLLDGEIPDRVGKADAPWPETRARWTSEGLPPDVHANDYFQMDIRHLIRIDTSFRLTETIEEDGPDYQIVRTADGVLTRCWKGTGAPLTLEFAVKDAGDWKKLRDRLVPSRDRIAWGYYGDYGFEYLTGPYEKVKEAYAKCPTTGETYLLAAMSDPFESFLSKLGDERLLIMMVTEPELVADMFDAHVKLVTSMTDLLMQDFRLDGIFLGGDLSYKNGMLFSPKVYRELLMPRHTRLIEHFKKAHGLQVVFHCDGNCTEAIPMLIETGIDCLEPLEAAAGLDVRTLAPEFGDRIAFMGNLSVAALSGDAKAVRREVESKVKFMTRGRYRYISHSDHSVPPSVSFDNYKLAMEIVAKHGAY
jgi:uroporphyrinogen decarboxylase